MRGIEPGARVYEDHYATEEDKRLGCARVIAYYLTTETYKVALDRGGTDHWAHHMTELAELQ